MKRSSFLASIAAAITAMFGFKKKPEKWNYMHGPTEEPKPLKWTKQIKFGEHYGDMTYPSWEDMGTLEFDPKIPVNEYSNEATVFELNKTNKVELSYIQDDKYMVVEYDTKTGEKKILRWYNTKDLRA